MCVIYVVFRFGSSARGCVFLEREPGGGDIRFWLPVRGAGARQAVVHW